MIIQKYFPRRLKMKVNWTWNRFKCRKLVKIWSKSGRLVLKSDWRLNQFYSVHIEARIWPIKLTKTDLSLTEMKCCGYEWPLGIAVSLSDWKELSEISGKSEKNRFLTRYSHFSSISLSRMPYWSSNLSFKPFRWKFLVSVTGSPEFRRRFRRSPSKIFTRLIHNYF